MDKNISRRKALRAGAMVGGALWVVPTVQVIGLSPASAQQVSPPPTSDSNTPGQNSNDGPSGGERTAAPATPVVGGPNFVG